jgi:hypothetical protein
MSIMPPVEFADARSSSTHCLLRSVESRGDENSNCNGMGAFIQRVDRPLPSAAGFSQEKVNDSFRRSFVTIASFRWVSDLSSKWNVSLDP